MTRDQQGPGVERVSVVDGAVTARVPAVGDEAAAIHLSTEGNKAAAVCPSGRAPSGGALAACPMVGGGRTASSYLLAGGGGAATDRPLAEGEGFAAICPDRTPLLYPSHWRPELLTEFLTLLLRHDYVSKTDVTSASEQWIIPPCVKQSGFTG